MSLNYINIHGYLYRYYEPKGYTNYKLLVKQIKRVKELIRDAETGCCKDLERYRALLVFLESLLKEKTE